MKSAEIVRNLRRLKIQTGGIQCLGCGYEHDCSIHGCCIMREAAALIEEQTARITGLEAKGPRWIPVTERIPPDQEAVLVLTRSKNGVRNVDKGYWAIDHFIHRGRAEVTHWMPLPGAPKEEKQWND